MFPKILNTLFARIIAAVASLLIAVLISQFLGAEGKGEQSLIITTIAMIMLATNLLAGAALVYLAPRYELKSLVMPALLWSVLSGGVAYIFLRMFPVVDPVFTLDVAILSVMCAAAGIMTNFLIGRERIASANLSAVLQPVLTLAYLAFRFFLSGEIQIQDYVGALYIAYGISALSGSLLLLPEWRNSHRAEQASFILIVRLMWHYGVLNQLSHIFQLLSFRMGYYFLDYFSGTASVGLYSNSVAIMESVWLLSKSIAVVQYARISNSDDTKYKQELTLELTRGVLVLTLLALIVLCALPSSVWVLVFGAEFSGLQPLMWTLAPGTLFFSIALLFGHYFSGNGRYQINTFASLAGLIFAFLFSVILIPWIGAPGAGLASSASYIVTALWSFYFFRKDSGAGWRQLIAGKKDWARLIQLYKEYRA